MLNSKILQFHQVQIMMNYKTLFRLITKLKMKTTKKNSKTFLRKINKLKRIKIPRHKTFGVH